MSSHNIDLWKLPALLYRTKKFEMSRYIIDNGPVNGVLRVANIPTDILKVDMSKIPAGSAINVENELILSTVPVVAFLNRGKKREPKAPLNPAQIQSSKKIGLVDYIVQEQSHEPWNEYVVQDDPPKTLRIRTVLTDVYYYPDFDTPIGDPLIEARHNPNIAVTSTTAPESGLT